MPALSMVSPEDLPVLPCPYCGRVIQPDTAWALAARERWGWTGALATLEGDPIGLLLVAPGEDPSGTELTGPSTAMVMCAWVRPGSTQMGTGRHLVQTVAAGLLPRQTRFIVARGSRHDISCAALPRDFLRAVGFSRTGGDGLWRLDLDQTVAERQTLRGVFERLVGSIRPVAPPAPAGRGTLR